MTGGNVNARRGAAGSKAAALRFLMYPQAEVDGERVDSYDPETLKHPITVREIAAQAVAG